MWNQEKFLQSVDFLVKNKCGGVQKTFNTRIQDRDGISRWKKGDRPSLEIINRIVDEFNCDYTWLLTGEEKSNIDQQDGNKEYLDREIKNLKTIVSLQNDIIERLKAELKEANNRMGIKSEAI